MIQVFSNEKKVNFGFIVANSSTNIKKHHIFISSGFLSYKLFLSLSDYERLRKTKDKAKTALLLFERENKNKFNNFKDFNSD